METIYDTLCTSVDALCAQYEDIGIRKIPEIMIENMGDPQAAGGNAVADKDNPGMIGKTHEGNTPPFMDSDF